MLKAVDNPRVVVSRDNGTYSRPPPSPTNKVSIVVMFIHSQVNFAGNQLEDMPLYMLQRM